MVVPKCKNTKSSRARLPRRKALSIDDLCGPEVSPKLPTKDSKSDEVQTRAGNSPEAYNDDCSYNVFPEWSLRGEALDAAANRVKPERTACKDDYPAAFASGRLTEELKYDEMEIRAGSQGEAFKYHYSPGAVPDVPTKKEVLDRETENQELEEDAYEDLYDPKGTPELSSKELHPDTVKSKEAVKRQRAIDRAKQQRDARKLMNKKYQEIQGILLPKGELGYKQSKGNRITSKLEYVKGDILVAAHRILEQHYGSKEQLCTECSSLVAICNEMAHNKEPVMQERARELMTHIERLNEVVEQWNQVKETEAECETDTSELIAKDTPSSMS